MMPSDKTSSKFLGLQVSSYRQGLSGVYADWVDKWLHWLFRPSDDRIFDRGPRCFPPPRQFSNLKALLKSATINNIPMERTNYG